MYFSFVIDVYSRMIVGWQLATHMRTDLVLDALRMALSTRQPGADFTLVSHSDQRVAARTQPVLATVPVDVTVPLASGRTLVGCGWGDSTGVTRLSSRRLAPRGGPERR